MSELYADIGWKSILHDGEQLCGDHVAIVNTEDGDQICVLADGLGSGVKASILSTLTSKIISTMMAQGLSLEDCVAAIADTLPVDSAKGVAYSTFSIVRIRDNSVAELIQFENPDIICLHGCNTYRYPKELLTIHEKRIYKSEIRLRAGDLLVLMSDGCTNASASNTYNYDWSERDIADYMKIFAPVGYTAKTLATMLADECFRKYGGHPLDDATACVIAIRPRSYVNIFFGPPRDRERQPEMLEAYFSANGKHIVCGGTTAKVVAGYLGKTIKPLQNTAPTDIPPMSELEGVDMVTEGVVTMDRVQKYALDAVGDNELYPQWSAGRDGACRIARLLFEEASDIRFFIGTAINPAHQNPDLPVSFNLKMSIVESLSASLKEMGKQV